jgi:transcriptional regulator with XRE-family HTH domain
MKAAVAGPKEPQPIDRHVGARIRHKRMMLGISQEALGDALGVTFQQVQKYEKGKNRISASKLVQIAQALQVPPAFFFEGLPDADKPRPPAGLDPDPCAAIAAKPDGLRLATAFNRIEGAKERGIIVNLAEIMAARSRKS